MCTISTYGRPFGPNGCQVPVGRGTCGETRTLEIISEFRRLYEQKLQQIDSAGGGDCLQEKIKLQQDWIGDLTAQNEMLVRAVEELEHEATERVQILEEKLQQSAQSICEVMKRYREYDVTNDLLAEPLQKVFCLESDQQNLLEFIRRIREENRWDVKGLKFYDISYKDLFGASKVERRRSELDVKHEYTNTGTTQREDILKDRDCNIRELQVKLEYYNSFGDVECLAKELRCKEEECVSLKKSMEDTRQALVEEIAAKHDTIVQLKNDCQQLEERCIQADKQTAFRDDIIKELRKELKQLRQQLTQDEIIKLNTTIDELQKNLQQTKNLQEDEEKRNLDKVSQLKRQVKELISSLKEAEEKYEKEAKVCKICRGRSKVGFAESVEVQASIDLVQLENQMETIQNKDDIIKVQSDTLNVMQVELKALKEKECEVRKEREYMCNEVDCLKSTIAQLEGALEDAEGKAANLQKAVDLYINSVNVLEASEEKCKIEIDQQKHIISNLQRALVTTKQELDELKQKSEENEQQQHSLISCLNAVVADMQCETQNIFDQCKSMTEDYEHLQDLNFDLEVDHCNSLQDVDGLENQLFKYQTLLRSSEDEVQHYRSQCKKLLKQKRGYEQVIGYFKQEMSSMSAQLVNLQDLLTLSNESTQEETCKLMQAYMSVQAQNEELSTQLVAAEQKVVLEGQMNQLRETKICELEQLISERELDLNRHDQAIMNIRQSLQCSLQQNEEMQITISDLNETIIQLENAVVSYEKDHMTGRHSTEKCWEQIECCRQKLEELKRALDDKTTELCKLEMAYNDQSRALKSAQVELMEMKERQKEKHCNLRCVVEELKEKLLNSEENYSKLSNEYSNLQAQLGNISRKEAVKDLEVKRYRKIVGDLKNTVIDLKKRLIEVQNRNQELEEESKHKDRLSKEKDKEYNELRKKLTEKLKQAQTEEARYLELATQFEKELTNIRQELEVKTLQLNDVKQSAQEINSSKCVQLACAQEEVNNLKEELNRILRQHCALNVENEKLHAQSACMQAAVAKLEEKSQLLKGQLEDYLAELQSVQNEKEVLVRKNRELLSELRSLQCSYSSANKRQRYTDDSVKNLECELNELRHDREEICTESKTVIDYVRAWLQEQKKINEDIVRRERDYCDTIQRLRQEYEELQCHYLPPCQRPSKKTMTPCLKPGTPPPTCQSPWSLGSQGTASIHDIDSPSRSPCPHEECDWYSSTFKNDSDDEDDEDDEDWVSKVESLAAQVRKANKMWKNKMEHSDYMVSKDTKK